MKQNIIEKDGKKYRVIKIIEEQPKNKVIVNGWDVTEFECWYDEKLCKIAVEQFGDALRYVKLQTPELCKIALEQYGDALQYVDKRVFDKRGEGE